MMGIGAWSASTHPATFEFVESLDSEPHQSITAMPEISNMQSEL
jgi:hypothetical protein